LSSSGKILTSALYNLNAIDSNERSATGVNWSTNHKGLMKYREIPSVCPTLQSAALTLFIIWYFLTVTQNNQMQLILRWSNHSSGISGKYSSDRNIYL